MILVVIMMWLTTITIFIAVIGMTILLSCAAFEEVIRLRNLWKNRS